MQSRLQVPPRLPAPSPALVCGGGGRRRARRCSRGCPCRRRRRRCYAPPDGDVPRGAAGATAAAAAVAIFAVWRCVCTPPQVLVLPLRLQEPSVPLVPLTTGPRHTRRCCAWCHFRCRRQHCCVWLGSDVVYGVALAAGAAGNSANVGAGRREDTLYAALILLQRVPPPPQPLARGVQRRRRPRRCN